MPLFFSFVIVVYCLVRFIVILHSSAIAVTPASFQTLSTCEVFAVHLVQLSEYLTHLLFEHGVVANINIAVIRLVNEPIYD
jgi:hypothetical protein